MVIIGLDTADHAPRDRRLFAYEDINGEPLEGHHAVITPYLLDGGALANPHLVVRKEGRPINSMGKLVSGTQPIDDGFYTFDEEERASFLEAEPAAVPFLRPYVDARGYLQGSKRWILALQQASPTVLKQLPMVLDRMASVRRYRSESRRKSTLAIADYPTRYNVEELPETSFLVVPKASSERREYVPIGWLDPPTIPSDLIFVLQDATLADFALLTSAMHMAWLRHIGGRLKSDYRYSIGLVYNTFPLPAGLADTTKLEPLAQAVLDARAAHEGATLADLYDPDLMPPNLRRAHQRLDRAVDHFYRRKRFTSERERVEYLFAQYERMQAPLTATASAKRRSRRRVHRPR